MAWQLLAMWAIVLSTIVWFVRDERRRYDRALEEKARGYAARPFRRPAPLHTPLTPIRAIARPRTPSPTDRAFIEQLQQASLER